MAEQTYREVEQEARTAVDAVCAEQMDRAAAHFAVEMRRPMFNRQAQERWTHDG